MSTLNPGSYYGKLIGADFGVVGQKDTPACLLMFEVTHIARDGQWAPIDPVTRDVPFYLTDNAREYAFRDMATLGFNGDFENPRFADDLYANGTELDVINETYNNKISEKVSVAKLKKGRDRKPMAADFKRTLAAQYRTTVQSTSRPSSPPPAPRSAPAATSPAQPAVSYTDPNLPPF